MTPEISVADPIASPTKLRGRLERLSGKRDELRDLKQAHQSELDLINQFLSTAGAVDKALDSLTENLFRRELDIIEDTLTKALQEILEQPVVFRAHSKTKNNTMHVDFAIERDGNPENIMKGQGGSVANIVSVGLRMFAVTTLDEKSHRRFLVLDEQDCWLHPSLVPKLVQIVRKAGTELGFQVLMISHHDVGNFLRHADRVYRLSPDRGEGVGIRQVHSDEEIVEQADRLDSELASE